MRTSSASPRRSFRRRAAFRDYRVMLDKLGDGIDGVIVSTPDHMHGAISLAAMALGKHVYVQKPLAHNLAEAAGDVRCGGGASGSSPRWGPRSTANDGVSHRREDVARRGDRQGERSPFAGSAADCRCRRETA